MLTSDWISSRFQAHWVGFLSDADMTDESENGGLGKVSDLIERACHTENVLRSM